MAREAAEDWGQCYKRWRKGRKAFEKNGWLIMLAAPKAVQWDQDGK